MRKRYENIDLLRFIASLCIVMVHILKNNVFSGLPTSAIYTSFASLYLLKMEKFVSLFFVISGFSISCGYYEKIKNNSISVNNYFVKRYFRILPFFGFLTIVESCYLLATHTLNSSSVLFETIIDFSLIFAFLPFSKITIVGVGWALGVIFAFYILYPFIVFCTWTKKRSWILLILTVFISYSVRIYFNYDGLFSNCNFMLWCHYFIAGVIIYLYKDDIKRFLGNSVFISIVLLLGGFYLSFNITFGSVFFENIKNMLSWSLVLISTLGDAWIISKSTIVKISSKYSFEVYLAHMLILRFLQKCNLISNIGIMSVVADTIIVYGLALLVAYLFEFTTKKITQNAKWGIKK